jgi:uncharacterized spore protein YtfJ
MEHIKELLSVLTGELGNVARSEVVVGDPIELGKFTVIPLSRISVGMGAGGGEGEGDFRMEVKAKAGEESKRRRGPHWHHGMGKGRGGGSGGGAKVRPVGVIIFGPDGVEVQPIQTKKGLLDKIFEKVPDVIDLVEKAREKSGK